MNILTLLMNNKKKEHILSTQKEHILYRLNIYNLQRVVYTIKKKIINETDVHHFLILLNLNNHRSL